MIWLLKRDNWQRARRIDAEQFCCLEEQNVCENQNESRWVPCPICDGRTKTKVYEDTVLVKFPLYCPKCKKEVRIDVVQFKMVMSKWAGRFKRRACILQSEGAGSSAFVGDYSIRFGLSALSADKTDSMTGISVAASCSLQSAMRKYRWRMEGLSRAISGLKISLESIWSERISGYRTSILGLPL